MQTAKATLSNFRQAPRKMRMVADTVRGKKVSLALTNLDFMAKKAALPIKKLIQSALSNAKSLGISADNLIVQTIKVDSGPILYRRRPVARGSAHPIHKRTSSVFVELGELVSRENKVKVSKEKKEKSEVKVDSEKKPRMEKVETRTVVTAKK